MRTDFEQDGRGGPGIGQLRQILEAARVQRLIQVAVDVVVRFGRDVVVRCSEPEGLSAVRIAAACD
ncbi:hypothetical protein [Nocardia brasiliensis]|uniref:hypothetical protein n=1 Tax=Nocardia brasiliensis TaxID=37326 RepID=UPI0024572EF4|nr:hypothetical protein [Nocardia brasiliensis]